MYTKKGAFRGVRLVSVSTMIHDIANNLNRDGIHAAHGQNCGICEANHALFQLAKLADQRGWD